MQVSTEGALPSYGKLTGGHDDCVYGLLWALAATGSVPEEEPEMTEEEARLLERYGEEIAQIVPEYEPAARAAREGRVRRRPSALADRLLHTRHEEDL